MACRVESAVGLEDVGRLKAGTQMVNSGELRTVALQKPIACYTRE